MIRLLRWVLLLGLLAALAWQEGWWLRPESSSPNPRDWRQRRVNEATVSAVDLLDRAKWLVYTLPPGQPLVRVVTNAGVLQSLVTATPTEEWYYTLHYQVLSRSGKVLLDQQYVHRTQLTTYTDIQTGELFTGRFYLHGSLFPTNGKVMVLNLQGLPEGATQLRLRVADLPSPLIDIVARVYCRESAEVQKLRGVWQRLSVKQQRILARGNLYPPELLSEAEKRNVLRQRWSTIAPEGVPGADYFRRDLYAIKDIEEEEETREPLLPAGLLVSPTLHGMLLIPEEGGVLRFTFDQLPWHASSETSRRVEVRWYGRGVTQRNTFTFQWNENGYTMRDPLPGGLLEIIPSQLLVARVFFSGKEKEQEITPDPVTARMYRVDATSPIDYAILHERHHPTPLRLSLRTPFSNLDGSSVSPETIERQLPPSIRYEFLGSDDTILQQGTLNSTTIPSLYDRILMTAEGLPVSDPAHYYFSLPQAITRVRIYAQQGTVLIAAANRPATLTRELQIPEEFYSFAESPAQPGWFTLWPLDTEHLFLQSRVFPVVVQPRPPEDDPEIVAGRYQWEDYHPLGSWRARQLLVPLDATALRRPQTLAVTFHEIPLGREQLVEFVAPEKRQEFTPTLLYVRPRSTSQPVLLHALVDGQVRRDILVEGQASAIHLSSLGSGTHRVLVLGPREGRVFLNYLLPEGTPSAFTVRTALHFAAAGLSFDYVKHTREDEMLSLRLHTTYDTTARTRVRVRITGPPGEGTGPYLRWTFRDRRYDIRPVTSTPVPVLGTQAELVTTGQFLALPLGDDLPPGSYRIQLDLEHGPGGYIIFSKVTPGVGEQRRVFLERRTTVTPID